MYIMNSRSKKNCILRCENKEELRYTTKENIHVTRHLCPLSRIKIIHLNCDLTCCKIHYTLAGFPKKRKEKRRGGEGRKETLETFEFLLLNLSQSDLGNNKVLILIG